MTKDVVRRTEGGQIWEIPHPDGGGSVFLVKASFTPEDFSFNNFGDAEKKLSELDVQAKSNQIRKFR